jgi:transposase
MSRAAEQTRQTDCDRVLAEWAGARGVDLDALDTGQRWVVFASLQFLDFVGPLLPLRRVIAYVLSHCGMELTSPVVAAVVERGERAIRKARAFKPGQFWKRLREARRGHQRPKLSPEHVGPVARFLAEHRKCSVTELLEFINQSFGVTLDRLTLRRFLKRYGLGCLREERVSDAPLLPAAPSTAAPSS